jgi:hypothetical protein
VCPFGVSTIINPLRYDIVGSDNIFRKSPKQQNECKSDNNYPSEPIRAFRLTFKHAQLFPHRFEK